MKKCLKIKQKLLKISYLMGVMKNPNKVKGYILSCASFKIVMIRHLIGGEIYDL